MLHDQFVKTFNDTKHFPTMQDVAREVGLSVQTVKNKAVALRRTKEFAGKLINRNGVELPMSENTARIVSATAEECIEALAQRLRAGQCGHRDAGDQLRLRAGDELRDLGREVVSPGSGRTRSDRSQASYCSERAGRLLTSTKPRSGALLVLGDGVVSLS